MLYVGHRGAAAYEPENTLRSFRRAFELGANAIELDVRATKDGVPVVIHDAKVNRTTNGRGKVHKLTFKEIRAFDAGSGERVPTLKETLQALRGKGIVLVEIKESGFEKKVAEMIKNPRKAIVISFDAEVLAKIKKRNPKIQTGYLFKRKPRNLKKFFALCQALECEWLMGKYRVWKQKFVDAAHEQGFKTLGWTIDKEKALKKYLERGLDGVTSNKPDLFKGSVCLSSSGTG